MNFKVKKYFLTILNLIMIPSSLFAEDISGNAYIYLYPGSNMVSISTNKTTPAIFKINGTYLFIIDDINKPRTITAEISAPGIFKTCTINDLNDQNEIDYLIPELRKFPGNNMSITFYSETKCNYSFFFGE